MERRILENTIETDLRARVTNDERAYSGGTGIGDSLWHHLTRVADLAQRLGRAEGVDETACRLAGLFHDAGKFAGGGYHPGDRSEEEQSVDVLVELADKHAVETTVVERVAESIRQLYRDDPDPTPLTCVLFDADNLDKLGPLGIANYFVKVGLKGTGVSPDLLYRLTVELTYARCAPHCLATVTGRKIAHQRAPETTRFFYHLIESLRTEGLYDFHVDTVEFNGLTLEIAAPRACDCGGALARRITEVPGIKCSEIRGRALGRRITEVPGIKCSEIHLEHSCDACEFKHHIRFCRPRLIRL